MNSVERMVHYAEEVEQENFKGDEQPPESWPRNGSLEFKDLYLSYRPELPPVLKGLNMRLESGEKLGIVGRSVPSMIFNSKRRELKISLGRVPGSRLSWWLCLEW